MILDDMSTVEIGEALSDIGVELRDLLAAVEDRLYEVKYYDRDEYEHGTNKEIDALLKYRDSIETCLDCGLF